MSNLTRDHDAKHRIWDIQWMVSNPFSRNWQIEVNFRNRGEQSLVLADELLGTGGCFQPESTKFWMA